MIKISTTLFKKFLAFPIPSDFGIPPTIQKILSKEDKAAAVDSPLVDLLSLIIFNLLFINIGSILCGNALKLLIADFIWSLLILSFIARDIAIDAFIEL